MESTKSFVFVFAFLVALISARYRIALNAVTLIDDNQARHALTELAQLCAHRDA